MAKKPDPSERFVWHDPDQIKIIPPEDQEKPVKPLADDESGAG